MSQENVEIVRRIHEAFLKGDFESMFALIADDVVWDDVRFLGGGRFLAHEGMTKASSRWFGAWDEYEVEFSRYIDAGDKVISLYRQRGRGKNSGIKIEMDAAQVWTITNGVVTSIEVFPEQNAALEAVGLSE